MIYSIGDLLVIYSYETLLHSRHIGYAIFRARVPELSCQRDNTNSRTRTNTYVSITGRVAWQVIISGIGEGRGSRWISIGVRTPSGKLRL